MVNKTYTRKKYNKTKKNTTQRKFINFYHEINKDLENNNHIPKNKSSLSEFSILQNKIDKQIKNIIFEKIGYHNNNHDSHLSQETKNMRNIFNSTIHWNNDSALEKIHNFITTMEHFILMNSRAHSKIPGIDGGTAITTSTRFQTSVDSPNYLYELLTYFIKHGISTPIGFDVIIDAKNTHQYISTVFQNGITFDTKNSYHNHNNKKKVEIMKKKFLKFYNNLFEIVFGKNHSYNISTIWDIEFILSKHMFDKNVVIDIENIYNVINHTELKKTYDFDLQLFLHIFGVPISSSSKSVIQNQIYLRNIMSQLNKHWDSNEWKPYWISRILLFFCGYHKELFHQSYIFFLKKPHIKTNIKYIMVSFAIERIKKMMNTTISKLYISKFENKREIEFTTNLFHVIKNVFINRLLNNQWMEKKTIEQAIQKIEHISFFIGYDKNWVSDIDMNTFPNSSIDNFLLFEKGIMNLKIKELLNNNNQNSNSKILSKHSHSKKLKFFMKDPNFNVFDVNAFYNNILNKIIIPNGILQKPFVDLNKCISYNMAIIGCIICHEIVHAFDEQGRKYNHEGNLIDWWSHSDKTEYRKKTNHMINEYEKMNSGLSTVKSSTRAADAYKKNLRADTKDVIFKLSQKSPNATTFFNSVIDPLIGE